MYLKFVRGKEGSKLSIILISSVILLSFDAHVQSEPKVEFFQKHHNKLTQQHMENVKRD